MLNSPNLPHCIGKPRSCLFTFLNFLPAFLKLILQRLLTLLICAVFLLNCAFFTYLCFLLFASLFSEHITYLGRLPFSACGMAPQVVKCSLKSSPGLHRCQGPLEKEITLISRTFQHNPV